MHGPFRSAPASRPAPDKIDLLLDIENSGSMIDARPYLQAAVADLLKGLIDPPCVDTAGAPAAHTLSGACPAGSHPSFPPVRDIHVGVVTTSLGARGGNACDASARTPAPSANVSAHTDDQAHLVDRSPIFRAETGDAGTSSETVTDTTAQDPFLYWYPSVSADPPGPGSPVAQAAAFIQEARDLVGGAGLTGCDLPSPLESWYRFLVQPDPYASIDVQDGKARWVGVDSAILQQRRDFLRPDSVVIILVASDRDDTEIDVRSFGRTAYNFLDGSFQPPAATGACQTMPASPACQSCAQGNNENTDPNCKLAASENPPPGFDLSTRFVNMKQRFGVDPQFPLQRYVNGLTSKTVPDRCGEYGGPGCVQPWSSTYVGQNDCQNPLYAQKLPDGTNTDPFVLCHTTPGVRTRDMVFYAHIGGVPPSLLHSVPGDAEASALSPGDWVKIVGSNPLHADTSGIDPHMIESTQPRPGVSPPGSPNGADADNGHDWITDTSNGMPGSRLPGGHIAAVDLEYACIFPLTDTTGAPTPRDCTLPQNAPFCSCPHATGGLTAQELPPICDQTTPTKQVAARAYPTLRELTLAKLMGHQAITGSLCPVHTGDSATGDDPLFGYRPTVSAILDALTPVLGAQCLPQSLSVEAGTGEVPCTILLQMPATNGGTCTHPSCNPSLGLSVPASDTLSRFCTELENAYRQQVQNNGGVTWSLTDPATLSVCSLKQLTPERSPEAFQSGSCASSTEPGWCYVTGAAAGRCPQRIEFSTVSPPGEAIANLVCSSPR
jgi:hypothetical protein